MNPVPSFSRILLNWHHTENTRQMPWKGEKDPYRIWLSEIILQQTRVEQGLNYYQRFVSSFPDVHALARASEQSVFKLWEGLGYYSRCRNLIASAKYISDELKGKFPSTYEEISKLKGVGPYTTAAISSFAFNLPYAVLDGNVFRLLSRYFGIYTPIDSTQGKKEFSTLAQELIDVDSPAAYNQAIMDFGATVCKPFPECENCPFAPSCVAFNTGAISQLPVRSKKIKIRKRWFHYLVLEHRDHIAIRKRTSGDIWSDLYEYPLIESDDSLTQNKLVELAKKQRLLNGRPFKVVDYSKAHRQQLSHQLIEGRFMKINLTERPANADWIWLTRSDLENYPFPRMINAYLQSLQG